MMEIVLELLTFFVVAFSVYSLLSSGKNFKDYIRIRDYVILGATIWFVGTLNKDFSVQIVGSCIWIYGFAILLYNHYKEGYEENFR
ncbi:hypothetical protein [Archaeoglobus sp.]